MSVASIRQKWAAAGHVSPRNAIAPATSTPFGTGGNGITMGGGTYSPRQYLQMKPYERMEALKTSRWLDNRLGVVGAFNDASVSYAIGSGVNSYSATDDMEYDLSCDRFVNKIFESTLFDIAEEQNMYELQNVAVRGMIVDGDCGAAKILQRDGNGRVLIGPQVQLFTSDQITSNVGLGGGVTLMSNGEWQEGIRRNAYGKPITYRTAKGDSRFLTAPTGFWDYQAKDFNLLLDRKRIQLSRGIPWCHRGMGTAASMLTIGALEEAAAHVNALFAAIITTPSGETPEALEAFINDSYGSTTTEKPDGTAEQKSVLSRYVEMMGGGKVPVFPEGTKLEGYNSGRSSSTWTGMMDYLITQYGLSYGGLPPSFIWATLGAGKGPDIRMTLAQASWYFNRILLIAVRRFIKPMRDWIVQYGILTGEINGGRLPKNGADYRLATYHGPRDITIDERYYHATWLDRLADGKGTEEEYFSLQGLNADTQAKKRIKEIANRKQWCKEAGIEYHGDYIRSAPGTDLGGAAAKGKAAVEAAGKEDDKAALANAA